MDIKRKLTSRKFWICVAAFLASVGSSIAGMQSGNDFISATGMICTIVSTAIYAASEAFVDASNKPDKTV